MSAAAGIMAMDGAQMHPTAWQGDTASDTDGTRTPRDVARSAAACIMAIDGVPTHPAAREGDTASDTDGTP